jgi:hypothetical protein
MQVGTGQLDYPVLWARDADASFVSEPQTYRNLLTQAGFRVKRERDCREFSIQFFARLRASWADGPPPLSPHIVIGPDFAAKITNVVDAMRRELLAPTEIISTAR